MSQFLSGEYILYKLSSILLNEDIKRSQTKEEYENGWTQIQSFMTFEEFVKNNTREIRRMKKTLPIMREWPFVTLLYCLEKRDYVFLI